MTTMIMIMVVIFNLALRGWVSSPLRYRRLLASFHTFSWSVALDFYFRVSWPTFGEFKIFVVQQKC